MNDLDKVVDELWKISEPYPVYYEQAKAKIQELITQARNETQADIAKHIEEYHYHKLNDVVIGNATIEQLINESKDRLKHLSKGESKDE